MSEIQIQDNYLVQQSKSTFMDITYQNLSYSIRQKDKERKILNNISGSFSKGLNAILGGSGAGKTSLLNILSKKITSEMHKIEGKITLNGVEYDNQMFQKFACYVMQEDILLATLTVREYLEFAANLKLKHLTQEQRKQEVNKIIKLLMLQKCENTLIGDHLNKGLSGGEKKRVCIGIELLGNPKVLFLDEPTSGLDSFTAYMIIVTLKEFANQENRTIIFTIHQPSSDIWELFDQVTLLVEGQFIYNGPRDQAIEHFANKGFMCPQYSNPADYFMNIMQSKDYEIYKKLWEQQEINQKNQQLVNTNREQNYAKPLQKENQLKDFFYSVQILTKRQLLNLKRNRILLKARFFQSLFMNLFLGLIYLDQSSKTSTPQEVLQVCKSVLLIGLGSFFSSMNPQTIAFCSERAVFLKEENSKMYTTLSYYISKTLPEILVCSWFGFQVTLICYFMYGFGGDASNFFFFALNFMLINNIGSSIGVLSCCTFEQASIAVSFAITFMMPQVLFSGIYKNVGDLPSYVAWCKYLTPTFYSTNAIVNDQFEGKDVSYNPIEQLHYDVDKWLSILLLIALYLGINTISYLLLKYRRRTLQ